MRLHHLHVLVCLLLLGCGGESVAPAFDRELLVNTTWNSYDIRQGHLVGHQPNDPAADKRVQMDSVTYQFTFSGDYTYAGRRWMVLGSDRAVLSYWYYSGGWEHGPDMRILKLYGGLQNRNNLLFEFEILSLTADELVLKSLGRPQDGLDTLYFVRQE